MSKEIDELKRRETSLYAELQKSKQLINELTQELNTANKKIKFLLDTQKLSASVLLANIKIKYLSHDSPLSIKINSFFKLLKKNKKDKQRPKKIETDQINYAEKWTVPSFEEPIVSIIIPAYNGWKVTNKCIRSIIQHTHHIAYEVILADDFSTDETKNIADSITNIIHIRNDKNVGFLDNCNNAVKYTTGKYILMLNNDTEVTDNWLLPLVSLIEKDATIGMVGSKLIYPDGKLQEAGGILWNNGSGANYGNGKNPNAAEYNYVKEADYVSGASILIRKDVWLAVGGFDERYSPAYYEDTDLAFQVRKQGYKVMYQPLSEVIHFEGYSNGTDKDKNDSQSIKSYQVINHKKFEEKWREVLQKEHQRRSKNIYHARDKSADRKTVLVIDHYVPQFDKDAGSKATFQYLQVLVSLGLNVKFIGDNFNREEPYTTVLQQMGIEVLYGVKYMRNWKEWIVDNADHLDFVILSRPHISENYIDFIRKYTNAKILYIGHDLHYLREQRQYEIEKNPKLLKSSAKWKKREMSLFSKSDVILTFSDVEQNIIRALNQNYKVETILLNNFNDPAVAIDSFKERNNLLFIGGFMHKPNADAVLWFCKEIFPLVQKQIPGITFIVAGSFPPQEVLDLQSDAIQIKGYISEQELNDLYKSVKIAVIPLRYGAGVKGKTVEALYNGLPIVSTGIGIEGMPGNHGFLQAFDEPQAFATELISLYTNELALQQASMDGINYINQNFTRAAAANKMKHLLGLA
jgi:GT2 family glycosyltransferase